MKVSRLILGGSLALGLLLPAALGAQNAPLPRGGPPDRDTLHALLSGHAGITRTIREVPGGVESETTATDAELARRLLSHVREMKARVEADQPVRRWDPLFAALFERSDRIRMEIEEIPGGVRVREIADDPETAALLRAHAARVSRFVAEGSASVHEPSRLPAGFSEPIGGPVPEPGPGPRAGRGRGHHHRHGAFAGGGPEAEAGCGGCRHQGHGRRVGSGQGTRR